MSTLRTFSRFMDGLLGPVRERTTREVQTASKAIFVVGCGHSGTSLMTSLIARHPDVLGVGDESAAFLPNKPVAYSVGSIRQWDTFCQQLGCRAFVEKTPRHIYSIKRIFRALPKARIVFTVRNPRDNIASLYRRTRDFEEAKSRYVNDNLTGLDFVGDERVLLKRYEDLVDQPAVQLQEVFRHCELKATSGLSRHALNQPDTLYGHWATKPGNRRLRFEQLSNGVYDGTDQWSEQMSEHQAKVAIEASKAITKRLGY